MNREIKFRAWDKKTKQIREASELKFDGTHYNVRIIIPTESAPRNWSVRMFDEVELMQYTGLKDKNGVEVYESDIVKEWKKSGVVKWNEEGAGFILECDDLIYGIGVLDWNHVEVIGNIYQNPELINSI